MGWIWILIVKSNEDDNQSYLFNYIYGPYLVNYYFDK